MSEHTPASSEDEAADTERTVVTGDEDEAEARADEEFDEEREMDCDGDADSGARGFGGYGELGDDHPALYREDDGFDCGFVPCDDW
jgi:hypothetical protein